MAKAVVAALRDSGFRSGTVIGRNAASGRALAAEYGFAHRTEVGAARPGLIVNATPIGMAGGAEADRLSFDGDVVAAADVVVRRRRLPRRDTADRARDRARQAR